MAEYIDILFKEIVMTITIADPVLILVGPTAIGKTALSIRIAKEFGCEIISMDSMQVYRYMDIGTAKITAEEMDDVDHHLLDITDPDDPYNAARFVDDALTAIRTIRQRGRVPLLTGGTGLYLDSLKYGLFEKTPGDKKIRIDLRKRAAEEGNERLHAELKRVDSTSAKRIHPNDTSRLIRALEIFRLTGETLTEHISRQQRKGRSSRFLRALAIGLRCDRQKLYQRINKRSQKMLDDGFKTEVEGLLARGYSESLQSMQAIGYRHMVMHLNGRWSEKTLIENLSRDTRRYAKRQFTWFNRDHEIKWFDIGDSMHVLAEIKKWLYRQQFEH